MADDVVAALDVLGVRGAVVVAHSLGGVVAFRLAAARPDLVSLLVVEDVCPPYDRDRPLPQRPDGVELPFDWDVVPAIAAESGVTDAAAWEALGAITAPTLLVAGGPSSHVPQERLDEVAARIPDCAMVTVDGGHHVHRAEPEAFAGAVLGWLGARA